MSVVLFFLIAALVIFALFAIGEYLSGYENRKARYRQYRVNDTGNSLVIGSLFAGGLWALALFFTGIAAILPDPPGNPAPRTTPIVRVQDMDAERLSVRGSDGKVGEVVLYGKREDDAFRVLAYKARIVGDTPGHASWDLSLQSGYRYGGLSIYSESTFLSDGKWQWGRPNQFGTFSSGETYEFSVWFDHGDDKRAEVKSMPVSF